MVRTLAAALALAALTTLTGTAGAQSHAQPDQLRRAIYSRAVEGRLQLAVYLPEGYAGDGNDEPAVAELRPDTRPDDEYFDSPPEVIL